MPDIQPPAPTGTVTPVAPPQSPAVQKTREQLAIEALGTIPDAPAEVEEPGGQEPAPVATAEVEETPANEGIPDTRSTETPALPADPATADFALIAAQRRAQAQARRAAAQRPATAPKADTQNEALAQALQLLTERLAPKPAAPVSEFELSLEALSRQTGKPVREIYALLTNQLAGKAGPLKVPVAPPSAQETALSELKAQVAEEKAKREALEETIRQSGEEWQAQQLQAEQEQAHVQLAQQFQGYVAKVKVKYPYAAAADPAEVGEALAIAAANAKTPLTAEQLVARLDARLKADYLRLKAAEAPAAPVAKATQDQQRTVVPQQPPAPPQRVTASAKKPFVIPPELHGVRGVSSAAEAARIKATMDLLKVIPDEE